MPVSSPSYFPPSRGTDQIVGITAGQSQTGARVFLAGQNAGAYSTSSDLIVIGHNAFSADNTTNSGTIAIGTNAAAAVAATAGGTDHALTVIGYNALAIAPQADSCVVIGDNCMAGWNATGGGEGITTSVVIGSNIFKGVMNSPTTFNTSVLIGANICTQTTNGQQGYSENVLIGEGIGVGTYSIANWVAIGTLSATGLGSTGAGSSAGVAIGCQAMANVTSGSGNVAIGYQAGADISTTNNSIVIGAYSGATSGDVANYLEIGTSTGAAIRGNMGTGNICVGNSTYANAGTLASGATNILKLTDGTPMTGSPSGGGYLYSTGGIIHAVDESGNDQSLNGTCTTGAVAVSFSATNKPGSTANAGPALWQQVKYGANTYYIPMWAA